MSRTLQQLIRTHWPRWLGLALAFTLAYQLLLLLALLLRFGALPNYVETYDLFAHYGMIIAGSPDWRDTLQLLLVEPLAETGYKNPDYYGISEWSLMLLPGKLLLTFGVSLLLATSLLLTSVTRKLPCPAASSQVALGLSGAGTAVLALTNASVTWVVCCASPTWVVMLAMLGLSTSVALALEPLGLVLGSAALLLMLLAVAFQTRALHQRLLLQ